jgi:hypothetical protein
MDTWPARLAKAAWEGITLPGDVYKGKVDPESEEGFRRTFDLASIASPVSPAMGTGAADARGARIMHQVASQATRTMAGKFA